MYATAECWRTGYYQQLRTDMRVVYECIMLLGPCVISLLYVFRQTTITIKVIASATKRNCLHVFNGGRCTRKIFNSRRRYNRSILKTGPSLKNVFVIYYIFTLILRDDCSVQNLFNIIKCAHRLSIIYHTK